MLAKTPGTPLTGFDVTVPDRSGASTRALTLTFVAVTASLKSVKRPNVSPVNVVKLPAEPVKLMTGKTSPARGPKPLTIWIVRLPASVADAATTLLLNGPPGGW